MLADTDKDLIVAWARSHRDIEAVWLFGSRARGDSRPNSDIDLAVMTPTELDWIDNQRQYRDELLALSQKADLNWYRPNGDVPTVAKAVSDHGLLLYRR
ncbi:nucleotidyltransferase domain protein [Ostertagia ostertagi]